MSHDQIPKVLTAVHATVIELGDAWAGNTINTAIFRHHGLLTHGEFQYTAFYVNKTTLRFVRRHLPANVLTTYDLAGQYNLRDAHNSISLGLDRRGYLHTCFDHHSTKLRYRKSLEPQSISGWTDDLPMTGQYENRVTYPSFIMPRGEFPLTLLYRDGFPRKGSARLKTYDETSQTWQDRPTPVFSSVENELKTSNAYWNHPSIGNDGSLHISFVWRTGVIGSEKLVNNVNMGYAWSPDNGRHWLTALGQPCQLPLTQVSAETIWPIPSGSNLMNQTSMALNRHNQPHIVFYSNDSDGIPQYQHLRFDGKQWHNQIISKRTQAFKLRGSGTLQIPISRPEIVMDEEDNVYVIYRGDLTGNRMQVTFLPAPDYGYKPENNKILWDEDLGFAEPVIDQQLWAQQHRLAFLLQRNEQPDHDASHKVMESAVKLIEMKFDISM